MIPANVIKAWSHVVPWVNNEQIEQDLVLSRALVEIFSNSSTNIQTYQLEEMIGTKLRALYQRKYGRDLYDIYKALKSTSLNIDRVIQSYKEYMAFVVDNPPSQKQFLNNLETKMNDREFLEDTTSLLRPDEAYDPIMAYETVKSKIIKHI